MRFKDLLLLFGMAFGLSHPALAKEINLVANPDFESVSATTNIPDGYELKGAATWGRVGRDDDMTTNGIIFPGTAQAGGAVSQFIKGIDQSKGRWLMFSFRGLAEDGFTIPDDSLKIKIEFYSKNGTDYMDCASRTIYSEIETDRKNLSVNGDYGVHGAAVWPHTNWKNSFPSRKSTR